MILLEAPQVNFTGTGARVCANGGSGGGGAGGNMVGAGTAQVGGGNYCANAQPVIGSPINGGGAGGAGGFVDRGTGTAGLDGDGSLTSAGGGGGGSVGRIGVRGTMTGTRQIESPAIQTLP